MSRLPSTTLMRPLQALVTNLDASPYLGRLAICRVHNGTLRRGDTVAWCRIDGSVQRGKVTELYSSKALERVETDEAGPGEIVAVAGFADVTIGETLADADDPRPLPAILVDEPSLAMTIGINTSPLSGSDGSKVTARLIKSRLDAELVGNVSLRVLPTDRPDAWEVQGRGELQLAVLVETMRREGFELTVGKPQVVTRMIDGKLHEPMERLAVDVPSDYLGVVTQLLALRFGRLEEMVNHGTGWVRMDYRVPAVGSWGSAPSSSSRPGAPGSCTTSSTGGSRGTGTCGSGATGRWWPTGGGSPPPTRSWRSSSAAPCSSGPVPRSTKG